eukprot:13232831-Alexandrium_andersonii.AAC.1
MPVACVASSFMASPREMPRTRIAFAHSFRMDSSMARRRSRMAPSPKAVAPVLCLTTYISAAATWSMSLPSGAKS